MSFVVLDTDVASASLRGRPRQVNDTWIAACCLVHGLPLATFNSSDFADFAANEGLQLIDAGPGPVRPTNEVERVTGVEPHCHLGTLYDAGRSRAKARGLNATRRVRYHRNSCGC